MKEHNKARINVCASLDGTVTISKVALEHNHDLRPSKSRNFRCNKNIVPSIKRRLEVNDNSNTSMHQTMILLHCVFDSIFPN